MSRKVRSFKLNIAYFEFRVKQRVVQLEASCKSARKRFPATFRRVKNKGEPFCWCYNLQKLGFGREDGVILRVRAEEFRFGR